VAVALAAVALVFGFAIPRLADYGAAWRAVTTLGAAEVATVLLAGLGNLVSYWPALVLALPGLRLREAALVNHASTAVANTVPAGGAVAIGMTYRMLRAWGFTSESIANQVLVTGVWNTLTKLALPVVALSALAATGELGGTSVGLALTGLATLVAGVAAGWWAPSAERSVRRLGRGLDAVAAQVQRRTGRTLPLVPSRSLAAMRSGLVALLRARVLALTAATVVSHLALYGVLLAALRAVGVADGEVSWAKVLTAFAFVRLLSALPITPGGLGVVELGYVASLLAGASAVSAEVTAGVLIFRAVTFVLPVLLGGLAWIAFQLARSWRRPADTRGRLDRRDDEAS
jgi:uncharacterized membrane protein YbhN (UPF0104 family)